MSKDSKKNKIPNSVRTDWCPMEHGKWMRHVLDNLIEMKQCIECNGMWFQFDHHGNIAYYRLSPVAPCDCTVCEPIDEQIENDASCVATDARWIEL